MNYYSESNQTLSKSTADIHELEEQLSQALVKIDHLEKERLTAIFAIEQANAARDDYTQRYQGALQELETERTTITWLQEQNETLISTKEYLINEREWMRGVLYNTTMVPTQKIVLMSCYEHAKSGEDTRIFVGTKAKNTGMYRQTFGNTLQGFDDLGVIDRKDVTKQNSKGKSETEVVIKFSEELLRFPGEIHIEKEDKRKGNGKGGGKNAKPKQCPECKSVQIDELDMCRCRKCNHEWEDGPAKDANRNANVTPWEYGQVEEDVAELAKEVGADELDKTTSTENVAPQPIMQEPEWFADMYQDPAPSPIVAKPKSDRHLPAWLRVGTPEWKKQVERCGLEEMQERRRAALEASNG